MIEVYVTRVFIPLADNSGQPFPEQLLDLTKRNLRKKFGGLTIWGKVRGEWVSPSRRVHADNHQVFEIAHPGREKVWWGELKETLRTRFAQEDIWILQSSSGWKVL